MVRDHGFGCVQQMQGQMHVQVTGMSRPVPLVGQFFRHLRGAVRPFAFLFPRFACVRPAARFRFRNRTSTARSVLVADFGPWRRWGGWRT
ncbi:hypothetical protein CP976_24245 [Streptomyces coeruleorubidus]|uniref:Uncharacterized protein n=1 Tax=Streptomyces coeruleorubidus TaxID=116188 RepID=A0A5J6I7S4_STRC4|nr:hypothetical protein CP976_24245 [Streptomyces coeruleorubidus]